jgi:hypothetical protein
MDDPRGTEPEGRYANLFRVGYNAFEVVVEFGQSYDSGKAALIHTRIATGPSYAKAFLKMLSRSIDDYEREFGAIRDVTTHDPPDTGSGTGE